MTVHEKAEQILQDIRFEASTDPLEIFRHLARKEYVAIHGPEHHVLDGACLLVAFSNAGGKIDLDDALVRLMQEGERMPGAMCGLWGVCGAVTSVGAALSILDNTGPLSADGSWGEHMSFTSAAVRDMGAINGPRCCKRDGTIALMRAIGYINSHFDVCLKNTEPTCEFFSRNEQCIAESCPFYPKRDE